MEAPAAEGQDAGAAGSGGLEEEAMKRNTDCVYFLASPLTCKKGSECEFRHSDAARMNPRDCWYWLNGSCLSSKCAFRHPPLDVFFGTPAVVPTVSSQASASVQMHKAANAMTSVPVVKKQTIPCYYFQWGHCLKGDMCPFLHGPQGNAMIVNPYQTSKVTASAAGQAEYKVTSPLQICQNPHRFSHSSAQNSAEFQVPAKVFATKIEVASNGGTSTEECELPAYVADGYAKSKPVDAPLANGNAGIWSSDHPAHPLEDDFQSGEEADEFLGESSPGFDVLVDGDDEDSNYYLNEDEFGINTAQGGRHRNSLNEFDYNPLSDSDHLHKHEWEFENYREYDQYVNSYEQHGWERNNRGSSERLADRSMRDGRDGLRLDSPEKFSSQDLHHRLTKQRSGNDSRLAASPNRRGDYHWRDKYHTDVQRYRSRSHRDRDEFPFERSISSRLQGRLKLPEKSRPHYASKFHPDRENGGRKWGSLPSKQSTFSNQARRYHERTRRRQDPAREGRNDWSSSSSKDEAATVDFAGPKSLSELKGFKVSNREESRSTVNDNETSVKLGDVQGQQQLESSLSFEGPKPLNVLLKRKREAASGNRKDACEEGNNQRHKVDRYVVSDHEDAADRARVVEEGEGTVVTNRGKVIRGGQLPDQNGDELAAEDGVFTEAMEDDQDYEGYDEGDEEYAYDQTQEGEEIPEDQNVDPDNEYFDDDDDDHGDVNGEEFAKKIGIMIG